MKFRFIGTAACDYSPLLNTIYKDSLDKDARRSSAALVDGHILIDCGTHVLESLRIQNIAYEEIDIVLLTHLHNDHYEPEDLKLLASAAQRTIAVYVSETAVPQVEVELAGSNVKVYGVKYGQEIEICEDTIIKGLPANHTAHPVHYLIKSSGKKIYYATDGAWIMYDAFYALRDADLDLLVLDATVGDYEGDYRVAEHNSIPMVRAMLRSFTKFNICDNGRIFITHIAPSLHKTHTETEEILKNDKIEVAYDGLEIEI